MDRDSHPSRRARAIAAIAGVAAMALTACGSSGGTSSASPSSQSSQSTGTAQGSSSSQALIPAGTPSAAPDAGTPAAADLGFRPDKNGLPFPNYGTDYPGLTPADVRTTFGDGACASTAGGTCTLTPEAQAWMETMNKLMGGGHCYGMSVLALQLYRGDVKPTDVGGDSVDKLSPASNGALTSRLAIDWAAQLFPTVQAAAVTGTPNDILARLIQYFQSGAGSKETYTLRIFSGTGGHAITPYAAVDKGNGMVAVLAYDNNYPGIVREVTFDKNANAYQYNGAANPQAPPDVYNGKIDLLPTTPGQGVQPCFFCGQPPTPSALAPSGVTLAAQRSGPATAIGPNDKYYQVTLTGDPYDHAHLVFTDSAGHKTGIVNGTQLSDVPDVVAETAALDEFHEADEPVYLVKVGTPIDITLDGAGMTGSDTEAITVVGPGIDAQLRDIHVDPGQQDVFTLSADGTALGYRTTKSESPILELARNEATADWAADLQVHGGQSGSTIAATLTDQALGIGAANDTGATYDLQLTRDDSNGQQVFKHAGIALGAGDVAAIDYTKFARHGDSIPATVQSNGQTTQQTLADQG
jgi:hypothetical protein